MSLRSHFLPSTAPNQSSASLHWVLLHGWGVDSRCWQSLTDFLCQHGVVQLIDIEYYDDIDFLCNEIQQQWQGEAVVMGWSLGGMLATRIAANYPEKVSRLITLATNQQFVADSQWPTAMAADVFDKFYQSLNTHLTKTLKRFMGLIVQGDEHTRQQHRYLAVSDADINQLSLGLSLLRSCNNVSALETIQCPSLHIFGQHDQLVPALAMDALQNKYPRYHYAMLEDAGHLLHMPASRLHSLLENFLNSEADV